MNHFKLRLGDTSLTTEYALGKGQITLVDLAKNHSNLKLVVTLILIRGKRVRNTKVIWSTGVS